MKGKGGRVRVRVFVHANTLIGFTVLNCKFSIAKNLS